MGAAFSTHWRKEPDHVTGYGEPFGYGRLRSAIEQQLNASRGIKCEPEQIFIVNGAQQAFALIGAMLVNPGETVWFENPGAIGARNAFLANGAKLEPINADEEGFCVDQAITRPPHFRLAFVTPSHQQPLDHIMSLARRLALLQAAKDADAVILEDDYDGGFHYGDQPPPTLKSIDTQERVIYVGTFSKSLFPSLRLGYVLLSRGLVTSFDRIFSAWQSGVPTCMQAKVADFMDEGLFATHVRTMRLIYKFRYDALVSATSKIDHLIRLQATGSGFHAVGLLPDGCDEIKIVESAKSEGVVVAALGRYATAPIKQKGLVLGFGSTPPEEIHKSVETLGYVLVRFDNRR